MPCPDPGPLAGPHQLSMRVWAFGWGRRDEKISTVRATKRCTTPVQSPQRFADSFPHRHAFDPTYTPASGSVFIEGCVFDDRAEAVGEAVEFVVEGLGSAGLFFLQGV